MSYVVAGWTIALATLALYSVSLVARRRRLARAVERAAGANAVGTAETASPGRPLRSS